MLRYLLNPKHLTSINRKQTGCEQKSGPHNRYANSSFPLPGSGIGWSLAAWSRTVCSLPTSHYTRFTCSTSTLLVHKRAALYNKNVVVDSLLRVGAHTTCSCLEVRQHFQVTATF